MKLFKMNVMFFYFAKNLMCLLSSIHFLYLMGSLIWSKENYGQLYKSHLEEMNQSLKWPKVLLQYNFSHNNITLALCPNHPKFNLPSTHTLALFLGFIYKLYIDPGLLHTYVYFSCWTTVVLSTSPLLKYLHPQKQI